MTDVLTRAARALCKAQSGTDVYDDLEPEAQEAAREHVRAVLEAIRLEPSEQSVSCSSDIVDAGRNAWMEWQVTPDDFKRANAATVDCWNAMIDAALAD